MNSEYGKQIAVALAAVQQLFADTSKLLQDCNKTIGLGRDSIFGNEVTRDLSKALGGSGSWMPSALYRYYDYSHVRPGLVTGICVCFRDDPGVTPLKVEEPLFIIGQIQFEDQNSVPPRVTFPAWAIWNGYFRWSEEQPLYQVIEHERDINEGILAMKLVAAPLYAIQSIDDVERLFQKVTSAANDLPSGETMQSSFVA